MNAYAMYLDPDHRDILYKMAPQVLLRINQLGLSATSDRAAEVQLLTSLPRADNNSGFRRGLSTLSFSPGTMARIIYHAPDPSAGDSPSASCSVSVPIGFVRSNFIWKDALVFLSPTSVSLISGGVGYIGSSYFWFTLASVGFVSSYRKWFLSICVLFFRTIQAALAICKSPLVNVSR